MRWRNNFPAIRLWLVFPSCQSDGRENQRLRDSLSTYKRIIVAVSEQRLAPYQPFFAKFVPESPAIYLFLLPGR